MTIYCVRYWFDGEPITEYFDKESKARAYYAELYRSPDIRITELELERNDIMRPSMDTILRILNGGSYVYKRDTLVKSAVIRHDAKATIEEREAGVNE